MFVRWFRLHAPGACGMNDVQQAFQVTGLGELIERHLFDPFSGRLFRSVTRQDDDRQIRVHFLEDLKNIDSVHVRQLKIDHGHVEIVAPQ